jgi:hypothetical protein
MGWLLLKRHAQVLKVYSGDFFVVTCCDLRVTATLLSFGLCIWLLKVLGLDLVRARRCIKIRVSRSGIHVAIMSIG